MSDAGYWFIVWAIQFVAFLALWLTTGSCVQ